MEVWRVEELIDMVLGGSSVVHDRSADRSATAVPVLALVVGGRNHCGAVGVGRIVGPDDPARLHGFAAVQGILEMEEEQMDRTVTLGSYAMVGGPHGEGHSERPAAD